MDDPLWNRDRSPAVSGSRHSARASFLGCQLFKGRHSRRPGVPFGSGVRSGETLRQPEDSNALKERMNCHEIQMKIGINLCGGLHSGKRTGNSGGLPDRDPHLIIRNGTILGYKFFSRSHWPEVDNHLELQGSHRKGTECCLTNEMRIRFWGKRRSQENCLALPAFDRPVKMPSRR